MIIDRPDWKKSLRNINVIDSVADTPFRRMIRKMPGEGDKNVSVCMYVHVLMRDEKKGRKVK